MMKAGLVDRFAKGGIDEINQCIRVGETKKPKIQKLKPDHMIVRVLACSFSPGDWRAANGSVSLVRTPKSWPYIPGHDLCGIVDEIHPGTEDQPFEVGDLVVCTSGKAFMRDGMAEFAPVEVKPSVKIDPSSSLTPEIASTLGSSAQRALKTVQYIAKWYKNLIDKHEQLRVLILGASGGYGTFLVQLLKKYLQIQKLFVAVTSTQQELMTELGADRVIDYNNEAWEDINEFKDNQFHLLIDCAEGYRAWKVSRNVLLPGSKGGRFCAVTMDDPNKKIQTYFDAMWLVKFILLRPMLSKALVYPPFNWPYFIPMLFTPTRECLQQTVNLVADGTLSVVFDPPSPLNFDTDGVCEAMRMVATRHAHGKIVVRVSTQ